MGSVSSPQPISGSIEFTWQFSDSNLAADPGNQKIALSTGAFNTVGAIYFNAKALSSRNPNAILSMIASGSRVYMQQKGTDTRAVLFQATADAINNTGWWSLAVAHSKSIGNIFERNKEILTVFIL